VTFGFVEVKSIDLFPPRNFPPDLSDLHSSEEMWTKVRVYKFIDEAPRNRLTEQSPHVDRATHRVENRIDVYLRRKLTRSDSSPEEISLTPTLRSYPLLTKECSGLFVVLSLADQGEQDPASRVLSHESRELSHVCPCVLDRRPASRHGQLALRILGERVEQNLHLRRPPAVDRLFGYARTSGNPLDCHSPKSAFGDQVVSGMENGEASIFATAVRGFPLRATGRRLGLFRH